MRACSLAVVALLLGGCASYHPRPLSQKPDLAGALTDIRHTVPAAGNEPAHTIDLQGPLSVDRIGMLAILNDPDLRTERGEMAEARAGVRQTSLPPNPSIGLGYEALIGGPATSSSYSASISQDVASLVTYHVRVQSSRAHAGQVNAALLWREWQVAQKARALALDLYWGQRSVAAGKQALRLLSRHITLVRAATRAGNLDLSTLAPLLSAQASTQRSLAASRLAQLRKWQALDALLGLEPGVRFAIAEPKLAPMPTDPEALIRDLPKHRPDLVALQLGYRSSEERVRAAILGQFPAMVLGGSWSEDTSNVRSAGPTVTFDLPIFDRNQGRIALARATRLRLHEQYQARLDAAAAGIRGLLAQSQQVAADLSAATRAAAAAVSQARTARTAYAQGNIDARALVDYETTALQRQQEVDDLQRSLGEQRIALSIELGRGLPTARIALPQSPRKP